MNVLGAIFNSKLNLNNHISNIGKSNSAVHCICLIKYHFTPEELKQIITSNYFSVLYYISEIWNMPNLSTTLKQKLLLTSANTLKIVTQSYHHRMSIAELHKINNRGTSSEMCDYKHAF